MVDSIIDPVTPSYYLKINADGSINVTGGTGTSSVTITDPTQVQSATTGVNVFLIDPSTGNAVTYTGATTVAGPTAVGSAAANPPVLIAGTANAGATGNVQVWKIDSSGTGVIGGVTASGSAVAANPVTFGGRAATANPTAVADTQVVNAMFDKLGKQVVVGAIRTLKGMQETTITSSTAETTIVSQTASTFNDLYGLTVANSSATATKVTLKDSTGGTTRWVGYVPAGDMRGFMLPVDSALPQATVNTNWTLTCTTSVASIDVSAFFVANT